MTELLSDPNLERFCGKFDAYVRLSDRYYRRARRVGPFNYNELGTAMDQLSAMTWEQEPMVEISLPQDRLRHLVEMDRWADKVEREYQGAKKFIEQEEHAAWVRQKDPRVRQAYERYQTLLRLVEHDYD